MLNIKNLSYWSLEPFKRYADFHGRACRKELLVFTIISIIISQIAPHLDSILGTTFIVPDTRNLVYTGKIDLVIAVLLFIPSLSVLIRRLHDINWGFTKLLRSIPIILVLIFICSFFMRVGEVCKVVLMLAYSVTLLFALFKPATIGDNRFGSSVTNANKDIITINLNIKKMIIAFIWATIIGGFIFMQSDFVKYEYSYLIGDSYYANREYELAIAWSNKSINNGSQNPKVYFLRGACYYALKDFVKAKHDFRQAINYYDRIIEKYPQLSEDCLYFVHNLKTPDKSGRAQFNLKESDYTTSQRLPKISETYFSRGIIYEIIEEYDRALSDYSIAYALNPQDSEILTRIGWMHFINDEISRALITYNKAIALDPQNIEAYRKRISVFIALKKYNVAVAESALMYGMPYKKYLIEKVDLYKREESLIKDIYIKHGVDL